MWELLLLGRYDVVGSCDYICHFFGVFGVEFSLGGISCSTHTSEWCFESLDGEVWGLLGGGGVGFSVAPP